MILRSRSQNLMCSFFSTHQTISCSVSHIVLMCSKIKMRRVYTRLFVAIMKNMKFICNYSIMKNPRKTMSTYLPRMNADSSIPMTRFSPFPYPTSSTFFNINPKPSLRSRFLKLVTTFSTLSRSSIVKYSTAADSSEILIHA